jgi:hypothetical protein
MTTASEVLTAAAMTRLATIASLAGVHEIAPVQAARPFATVEAGSEIDWSHKTGFGREVRLAVTIRDKGERPERLRRLMGAAEAAMVELGPADDWTVVTLTFLRSRIVAEGKGGWAGILDYRVRMLAAP